MEVFQAAIFPPLDLIDYACDVGKVVVLLNISGSALGLKALSECWSDNMCRLNNTDHPRPRLPPIRAYMEQGATSPRANIRWCRD